ncbi:hypothetical protein BD779DRAFT_1528533 [Infundibulicybe gibba]|nr:hypothetical protein BD779DRAFT_1528533 [Infundibulicybe gibba]
MTEHDLRLPAIPGAINPVESSTTQTPEPTESLTSTPQHTAHEQADVPRSSPPKSWATSWGKKRTTVADLMSASTPLPTTSGKQRPTLSISASQPLPRPRPKIVPRVIRNATPGPSGLHSRANRVDTVSPPPVSPSKSLKRKFVTRESEPDTSDWSPPPYPLPSPPRPQGLKTSPVRSKKPKSTNTGKRGEKPVQNARKPVKQKKGAFKPPAKAVEVIEISWSSEDERDQQKLSSSQARRISTSSAPRSGPGPDAEIIDLCSSDDDHSGTPPPASPSATRSQHSHSHPTEASPSPTKVSTPTPDLEIDLQPTRASTPEISITQMVDSSPQTNAPQVKSPEEVEPSLPNSPNGKPQAVYLDPLVPNKPCSLDLSPAIFHPPVEGARRLPVEISPFLDLDHPLPHVSLPSDIGIDELDIDEYLLSNDFEYPD